jgi:uncharacterized membrane protein
MSVHLAEQLVRLSAIPRRFRFSSWPTILTICLIILYILTFGLLATRRHLAYETSAFDLGDYDQAMWNAAHGRGLALTTLPSISLNRLGLHVEPILFLLVPLYWIWPSPLTLLWLQTLALGLAAWPLYLLAQRRLGSEWSAVVIVLAYLLLPATQAVNLFDFHAVALSPLFMLAAIYFLDRALANGSNGMGFWSAHRWDDRQDKPLIKSRFTFHVSRFTFHVSDYLWAGLFFVLAMATKEDIPLHVFMVGLYVMFLRRRWRVGLILAVVGVAWAFVAFGWVIPAYRVEREPSAYVNYFPTLGDTPLEIALSPLTKPAEFWQLMVVPENMASLKMVTLPFAFLNVIGLPVFLLSAPSLAISFLSNNPLQKELETWHYAAPMLPFIVLGVVDGLARLSDWLGRWGRRPLLISTTILVLVTGGYHYWRGYSPLSKPFHWPQVTAHHALGDEIAASIPPSARVIAQAELVPHLSQREQITIWTGRLSSQADYVFLDVSHPEFPNQDNAHLNLITEMIYRHDFGLVRTQDGYILLKKGAERIPIQEGFQDFLFADESWRNQPSLAQFGDWVSLVGVETYTQREAEPQVSLYFHVLQQPAQDYFICLYLLNEAGEPAGATVVQQPALIWWPTHMWQPGQVIEVRFNTLSWWTGDGRQNRFSYAVGILSEDAPWEGLRLPVSGERAIPGNLAYVSSFQRLAHMVYPLTSQSQALPGQVRPLASEME